MYNRCCLNYHTYFMKSLKFYLIILLLIFPFCNRLHETCRIQIARFFVSDVQTCCFSAGIVFCFFFFSQASEKTCYMLILSNARVLKRTALGCTQNLANICEQSSRIIFSFVFAVNKIKKKIFIIVFEVDYDYEYYSYMQLLNTKSYLLHSKFTKVFN